MHLFDRSNWILWVVVVVGLSLLFVLYANDPVNSQSSIDPNCTLISQEMNLKTYYCYNPENGENYYRNNMGFIVLDKES